MQVKHLASRHFLTPIEGCKYAWRPQARPPHRCFATAKVEQAEQAKSTNNVPSAPRSPFQTGSADITTSGASIPLVDRPLANEKTIVIVRHGLTTWNEQQRIQGDSDEADLTAFGEKQAERCRRAISRMHFDSCYSSPIRRGRHFADILWAGRQEPIHEIDTLKEAHLGWLQGLQQAEAAEKHEKEFRSWREKPSEFVIGGRHPIDEVFTAAMAAWKEVLEAPGESHILVTHKSILRALLCVAMGLPPTSFRAFDIHNGGLSVFRVNKRGEPMLINMNLTAHMHTEGVFY